MDANQDLGRSTPLSRRQLLGAAGAAAAAVSLNGSPASGTAPRRRRRRPPNIILIQADDLGYGELGSYGQRLIHTPNLDRLAADGTRFTQYYCGSPICSPSRGTMMTGKHTGHATVHANGHPANAAEPFLSEARLPNRPARQVQPDHGTTAHRDRAHPEGLRRVPGLPRRQPGPRLLPRPHLGRRGGGHDPRERRRRDRRIRPRPVCRPRDGVRAIEPGHAVLPAVLDEQSACAQRRPRTRAGTQLSRGRTGRAATRRRSPVWTGISGVCATCSTSLAWPTTRSSCSPAPTARTRKAPRSPSAGTRSTRRRSAAAPARIRGSSTPAADGAA